MGRRFASHIVWRERVLGRIDRVNQENARREAQVREKAISRMSDKYILADDGKTPIPCSDLMKWARFFEKCSRTVRKDTVNDVEVSTVFLGLDHSYGSGPPILWETMIFGGEHDQHQDRYSSHDDAVTGHARALAMVKGEVAV